MTYLVTNPSNTNHLILFRQPHRSPQRINLIIIIIPLLLLLSLDRHIGVLDKDSVTEDWKNDVRVSAGQSQELTNSKPPLPTIVNLYDFEAAAR